MSKGISVALTVPILGLLAACSQASPPIRLHRPDRPVLEEVEGQEASWSTPRGETFTAIIFEGKNGPGLQRNLKRVWGYIHQLEAAPFWAEPPPPRVE